VAARPDPAGRLGALADALGRPDGRAMWSRLTRETRAQSTERTFLETWSGSAAERAQLADRLRAAASHRAVETHAELDSAGQLERLVFEDDRWRLEAARPTTRGASTPEEALRRFTAALEAHDLDALLHLLGDPLRTLVERELNDRLSGLRATVGQPVATDGDHAHVRYDAHHHIDLRRENGQWQVVDFN
jgi:hypothetical protein